MGHALVQIIRAAAHNTAVTDDDPGTDRRRSLRAAGRGPGRKTRFL